MTGPPLSNFGEHSRQYLNLVNFLLSIGVNEDIELPFIIVIGNQSSGKSSLIEAISSIALPRQSLEACTRVPIECRLSRSDTPWRCNIKLQFAEKNDHQELPFGELITDPEDPETMQVVKDRIRRAQAAILNPDKRARAGVSYFLTCNETALDGRELRFSQSAVCVEISGPYSPDLTFVDLPGLIQSVGSGGDPQDIKLVEDLARRYAERNNSIILLTIVCETDAANQAAYDLARKCDPKGQRTVGVLTKADRINRGEEPHWLRYLQNKAEPLSNGWYAIKQPDTQGIRTGVTHREALQQEDEFFEREEPWRLLPFEFRSRLGARHLQHNLEDVLAKLISRRVPMLGEELLEQYEQVERALCDIPPVALDNPIGEVTLAVANFVEKAKLDMQPSFAGTLSQTTFFREFQPLVREFKQQVRSTAPNFRPWEKSKAESLRQRDKDLLPPPEFLRDDTTEEICSGAEIFLDDVRLAVEDARSDVGGLPDTMPAFVPQAYMRQSVELWKTPSEALVKGAFDILFHRLRAVLETCFKRYAHGGLDKLTLSALSTHLKKCRDEALAQLQRIHKLELRAFVTNDYDFRRFKAAFKAHYQLYREIARGSLLFENLNLLPYNPNATREAAVQFRANMESVKATLAKLQVSIDDVAQIARLLPDDSAGPALEVMASTRASFEVAYRRFTDYAPQIVLQELVDGALAGLREAIDERVQLRGPEILERCRKFLEESPHITEQRRALQRKRERLVEARRKLQEFEVPTVGA